MRHSNISVLGLFSATLSSGQGRNNIVGGGGRGRVKIAKEARAWGAWK